MLNEYQSEHAQGSCLETTQHETHKSQDFQDQEQPQATGLVSKEKMARA